MGLLGTALAGAAGGLGEQMIDISKRSQEEKAKAKAATIDHQRQKALERLKQKGAMDVQGMAGEQAMERTQTQVEGQMGVQRVAGTQAMERTRAEVAGRLAEEEMGIKAGKYATASGSSTDPVIKALVDRYDFKTESIETFRDGMPVVEEKIKITDKVGGRVYSQEGDILRMANDTVNPKFPPNRPAAERDLLNNPQAADSFYSTYHYLPSSFLQKIREAALANEGRRPLGTPSEE